MKSSAPPTGPHSKSMSGQCTAIFGRPGSAPRAISSMLGWVADGQCDRVPVATESGIDPEHMDNGLVGDGLVRRRFCSGHASLLCSTPRGSRKSPFPIRGRPRERSMSVFPTHPVRAGHGTRPLEAVYCASAVLSRGEGDSTPRAAARRWYGTTTESVTATARFGLAPPRRFVLPALLLLLSEEAGLRVQPAQGAPAIPVR